MRTDIVSSLPACSECTSEGRTPPNDSTWKVKTPTKVTVTLCDSHFFDYVESRLGANTVTQLAIAATSGSARKSSR